MPNKCRDNARKFFQKVHTLFIRAFDDAAQFINTHITPVLHFMQGLKAAIDNPAADVITAIIPGTIDDGIVKLLRIYLGQAIEIMQIQIACSNESTLDEKIRCYIEHLRALSPDLRNALLHKTASILTRLSAADGKPHNYTNSQIDVMVNVEYVRAKLEPEPTT